jgi:hypothetical protein
MSREWTSTNCLKRYSGTSNNGHCRGISILSVMFVSWGFVKWLILRLSQLLSDPVELTPLADLLNLCRLQSCYQGPCTRHYRCRKLVWTTDLHQQLLFLWPSLVVTMNGNYTGQEYVICRTVHINISEKWNVIVRIMSCVGAVLECQMGCVYCRLSPSFFNWPRTVKYFRNR